MKNLWGKKMKCTFKIAWVGECGIENCENHSNLKCIVCGERATHSCDATSGLVCGAALCDNCEELLSFEGVNTLMHCKKEDQKYTPWFMRDKNEGNTNSDIYPHVMSATIREIRMILFLSSMKDFKEDPEKFKICLNERIKTKEEELFNYMKDTYPSSIQKKENKL